jgi:hypothetical protein
VDSGASAGKLELLFRDLDELVLLKADANELRAAVSKGYSRGRHGPQRERKE